jgi:N-acetylglucosaminyl-diphospho-decaprenol L-rhamnosyltransferase
VTDKTVDVSILIVSYNTRDLIVECIESIHAQTSRHSYEIIVIDNDSDDDSVEVIRERFPDVKLIASGENVGFACANNVASEHASGRRLLLLNPDTLILENAIDTLLDFAGQNPGNRMWGGRHVFRDGSMNTYNCWTDYTFWTVFCSCTGLARFFPNSALLNPRPYPKYDRMSVKEVDVITGCYLLIDTDLWNDLGGFDRDFFLFAEEVDLCVRARRVGARPLITPDSKIVHDGGGSAPIRSEDRRIQLLKAERQFHRKHFGPVSARAACLLIDFRVTLLALMGTAQHLLTGKRNPRASMALLRRRKEWA